MITIELDEHQALALLELLMKDQQKDRFKRVQLGRISYWIYAQLYLCGVPKA